MRRGILQYRLYLFGQMCGIYRARQNYRPNVSGWLLGKPGSEKASCDICSQPSGHKVLGNVIPTLLHQKPIFLGLFVEIDI